MVKPSVPICFKTRPNGRCHRSAIIPLIFLSQHENIFVSKHEDIFVSGHEDICPTVIVRRGIVLSVILNNLPRLRLLHNRAGTRAEN